MVSADEIRIRNEQIIKEKTAMRARLMKKIEGWEDEIREGIESGSAIHLDWSQKVLFFLDGYKDLSVHMENFLESWRFYVEEQWKYIESQPVGVDASLIEEKQDLIDSITQQLQNVVKQRNLRDSEIGRLKGLLEEKEEVVEEELVQEPKEEFEEEPEEELIESEEEPEGEEKNGEEELNGKKEELSKKEEPRTKKKKDYYDEKTIKEKVRLTGEKKTYVTDTALAHIKDTRSPEWDACKKEASVIRNFHPEFSDYSTIEHRFYKNVASLYGIRIHDLDVSWVEKGNFCRVCKEKIKLRARTCSKKKECYKVKRNYETWVKKHAPHLLDLDSDLRPPESKIRRRALVTATLKRKRDRQKNISAELAKKELEARREEEMLSDDVNKNCS